MTAALFTLGKTLIGWYIGTSAIASSYGAAGGLLVILLWVYYSSEIFLLGAEFTRAYSVRHGSRSDLEPTVRRTASAMNFAASGRADEKVNAGGLTVVSLIAVACATATLTALMPRSRRP